MTKNSFPIAYIKKTFRKKKEVWVVFGEMYSQKSTKNNFRVEVLSLLMNPTLDIIALMPYCRYDHAIKSTFKYVAIESGTIGLFKSFRVCSVLENPL